MWELLSRPAVQATLGVGVLLVVAYCAIQLILRLRPTTSTAHTSVEDLVANFEEMQLEGEINEAELRKIRAVLGKSKAHQRPSDETSNGVVS